MPKTLLLADDSVTIQKVVGLSFANEDVKLVTVDNGDDAVERARAIQPDLILADVVMPGLSGYEVCEAIKGDAALNHIPVLLLSGTFDPFDEQRAERAGAVGHVVKPFESQALVARVKAILAEASQLEPSPSRDEEPTDADVLALDSESFDSFDSAFISEDPLAEGNIALDDEALMEPIGTGEQGPLVEDLSTYILEANEAPNAGPSGNVPGSAEQWATSSPRDQLDETIALSQDSLPFSPTDETSLVTNFDESEWDVAPMEEGFEVSDLENFDLSTTGEVPTQDFASMEETTEAITSEQAIVISEGPSNGDTPEDSSVLEVELADAEEVGTAEPEAADFELTEPQLEEEAQENLGEENLPVASEDEEQLAEIEPYEVETIESDVEIDVQTPGSKPHHVVPLEVQQNIHDTLEKIAWEAFGAVTEKLIQETVKRIEAVAWEVIPQMAESLIKEEIQRLKAENDGE